ncbi:MAG: thioredoxin [Candidatus Omnitrophota bacterium]|jgi:thioredoxin 1|nr:thioredoxin [Candidatus Omnitrophota bacterium]
MVGSVVELTTENFEKEVLQSQKPVIVDFWATWCGPCKMIAPIVGEISLEYKDQCKVAKLNIDEAMGIATKFGVMNIPTIIFFKAGQESSRLVGVVSKDSIAEKIDEMLG